MYVQYACCTLQFVFSQRFKKRYKNIKNNYIHGELSCIAPMSHELALDPFNTDQYVLVTEDKLMNMKRKQNTALDHQKCLNIPIIVSFPTEVPLKCKTICLRSLSDESKRVKWVLEYKSSEKSLCFSSFLSVCLS